MQTVYVPVDPKIKLPQEGLFKGFSENVIGVTKEGKSVKGYYKMHTLAFYTRNPKYGEDREPIEHELNDVFWVDEPTEAILLTKEDTEKIKEVLQMVIKNNSENDAEISIFNIYEFEKLEQALTILNKQV